MRRHGFLGRLARVARNPCGSCFQSFTPAERVSDEGWLGPAGMQARTNVVLPDQLCS